MRTHHYDRQRTKVTPPHVSLADLRTATGITQDELCKRIGELIAEERREEYVAEIHNPKRGTISAIESGTRGASADMLRLIAIAYGMRPHAVVTNYRPRGAAEDVAA